MGYHLPGPGYLAPWEVIVVVIGIDPGTMCGWALVDEKGKRQASGVWDLRARRHEGGGMRYLRVRRYLEELLDHAEGHGSPVVAYEEVRRHRGTDAAHVYGGIVASIVTVCEERRVPYSAVPVGTVKRTATGRGNATKIEMTEAFIACTGLEPESDDESDAYWVAVAQCQQL
jgi:crossover junction endodeoxyribonuclease RuvC